MHIYIHIYVYDNNSTDGTDEIARAAGAVVRYEYRQGKGNVIRSMFREIDADCYVMADGDDTYPAENAPELVRLVLEEQADMVVGDRLSSTYFTENKRPFHNLGNSLVRASINLLFRSETDMSIHAVTRNMLVRNVVIDYRDRPDGSVSKLNTYSDGAKVLLTIARLFKNYKPFAFFGLISLVLVLLSGAFMIPVLTEFFATGLVPRFPTLIVCGITLLAALLLFISGLILSTLQEKDKRDFEFQLQQVSNQYRSL